MSDASISVVVCDDVPELRTLARRALELDPELKVVGEASDGRESIEVVRELQPNVVVLDLSMPEMDGLEAIPLIHGVSPETQIVVFSGFEEGRVAEVALQLGAGRYVRKGAALEELRSAVKDLGTQTH